MLTARMCTLLTLAASVPPLVAQSYPTGNLLTNPDFETGDLSGWQTIYGGFQVLDFGTPQSAPLQVGLEMNGGSKMASATSYSQFGSASLVAELAQTVDLTSLPNSAALLQEVDLGNLELRFAAWQGDNAQATTFTRLQMRFYNASNAELGFEATDYYTWGTRNGESTMQYRRAEWAVPPLTRRVRASLFIAGGAGVGFIDNVSLEFQPANALPAAVPLDTNVLVDPDFERSTLINPGATRFGEPVEGWRRTSGGPPRTLGFLTYGAAGAPSPTVSNIIGGGQQSLTAASSDQIRTIRQDIDLRGNAPDIQSGSMFVDLEGFFGGSGSPAARSALIVDFFFPQGGAIPGGSFRIEGPLAGERNGESTMVRRSGRFPVPTAAGSMGVTVYLYQNAGGPITAIDNVSVQLRRNPPPPTPTLGQNLLANSGFESGPNNLITPLAGWSTAGAYFAIVPYGLTAIPFSTPFNIGGQQYLLSTTAGNFDTRLTQTFDISGHAAKIDTLSLGITLSGWMGGVGTDPDDATLRVVYRNAFGGPVPSLVNGANDFDETDPVLPADRNNVTDLVYRERIFTIPPGTREIDVELRCNRRAGGTNDALADVVSAVLSDLNVALVYPGTNDDLELLTGVNALPSGGPLEDIKTAAALDTLTVSVESPNATLNFQPLLLAVQVLATGNRPGGFLGLPGIELNPLGPTFFPVLNPSAPGFFPPVVIPGGTTLSFVLPSNLLGSSLFWQGVSLTPLASNGVYAATDAHEIRIQ